MNASNCARKYRFFAYIFESSGLKPYLILVVLCTKLKGAYCLQQQQALRERQQQVFREMQQFKQQGSAGSGGGQGTRPMIPPPQPPQQYNNHGMDAGNTLISETINRQMLL